MTGPRRMGWTQLLALVGVVGGVAMAPGALAATSDQEIATLEASGGQVLVIRLGQSQQPSPSMPLQLNDIVVTKRGRASVRFHSDGTVLRIGPDTRVQVNESAKDRDIQVFFGKVWAHVVRWKERPTRFISSSTIAAMRGTELSFAVDGDETRLSVLEGRVLAENDAGSLTLAVGQSGVAVKGKAPQSLQVRPQDAVQWALYYPPVLYLTAGDLGEGSGWQGTVRESTAAYRKGDLERAIVSLEGIPADEIRDPRFFTHRASFLLAAGDVEDAGQDLDRALSLAASQSDALALKAIVAVANNQKDAALSAARQAVAADKASATAQIALSYALQARFDLEGARESLETAVRLQPDDALAWTRLAELRSSFGDLGDALKAAQKAIDLEPNLARTQTVLGYAYLTQVRTREARTAFEKAVELDAADPLARLGLGLARIRDGELTEGSREIEIAVSLDPGQALIRSYLGKAYFEAKRADLDQREYDVAKESDPRDPTPWLYDAIAKQTTNRPVEALRSLQQAIELNDNRAVYRSRLLLDSDLAARSASLGRLYADLGFQNLALVEGWNSVNTDPSNYSAHRLLADSYAALPRHEIARVSELFQSQMLQPLNTTPIQPSLGESSLFLISSQGAGALAFNEFNPLFNRDQVNVQGSFLVGQDATWSGEGIVSGIHNKASFSAGYSGFQTDGFRANSGQEDQIANAFGQLELSPNTSVQVEVRHREQDIGDLELRFLGDDFSLLERQNTKSTNGRVGVRHVFSPSLTVLGSYLHQDKDIAFSLPEPDLAQDFSLDRDERANSVEGQLLFRSGSFKVVGGAGRFDIDDTESLAITIDDPEFGFTDTRTTDRKIGHTNVYAYSYVSLPRDVTLTLGLSGDLFDEDGTAVSAIAFSGLPPDAPVPVPAAVLGSKDQANPKLGILWSGPHGTTLRAAAFRTLKRTLVTDQTLEPTQVAGFNQFFDDPSATRSWVYGAGIDQKFGRKLFGGAEFYRRDMTIPQTLIENNVDVKLTETEGDERLARAYLFSAPNERLTLGVEYEYEDSRREPGLGFPFEKVKTHRVPISARFFHPSGVSALLSATLLDQEGEFFLRDPFSAGEFVPGDRTFWVVDAGLRYRLPKRRGFVAIGVNNLTDERSTYQATDSRNLRIRPGRTIFARVILALP